MKIPPAPQRRTKCKLENEKKVTLPIDKELRNSAQDATEPYLGRMLGAHSIFCASVSK